MTVSDDDLSRATEWLKAWDSHGVHRTGTAGDEAGSGVVDGRGGAARRPLRDRGIFLRPGRPGRRLSGDRRRPDCGRAGIRRPGDRRRRRRRQARPGGVNGGHRRRRAVAPGGLRTRLREAAPRGPARRLGHHLRRDAAGHGAAQRRALSRPLRRAGDPCLERGQGNGAGRRPGGVPRRVSSPTAASPRRGHATSSRPFAAASLDGRRSWS